MARNSLRAGRDTLDRVRVDAGSFKSQVADAALLSQFRRAATFAYFRWPKPRSFFNGLDTALLQVLKVIAHFFEPVGRETLPIRNFAFG